VEAQRTSHLAFSFTQTLSYKLKHSLSLFEMAEQNELLDLWKEFVARKGMVLEG